MYKIIFVLLITIGCSNASQSEYRTGTSEERIDLERKKATRVWHVNEQGIKYFYTTIDGKKYIVIKTEHYSGISMSLAECK